MKSQLHRGASSGAARPSGLPSSEWRVFFLASLASLVLLAVFVLIAELDRDLLHRISQEDGPVEYATAALFGLTGVLFLVACRQSDFLRDKQFGLRYFMLICWALLMFVFLGEEISWGQRIWSIETPESLAAINLQQELNIHNIELVSTFLGGKYRYLSVMMFTTGLLLPLFALSNVGKRAIQWFAFPVAPIHYWLLFVGSYLFGKYYYLQAMQQNDLLRVNDAAEVRELLMSIGMFCFALHGAIRPCVLFRVCAGKHRTVD